MKENQKIWILVIVAVVLILILYNPTGLFSVGDECGTVFMPPTDVRVVVLDSSGDPVEGAKVEMMSDGNQICIQGQGNVPIFTDSNGIAGDVVILPDKGSSGGISGDIEVYVDGQSTSKTFTYGIGKFVTVYIGEVYSTMEGNIILRDGFIPDDFRMGLEGVTSWGSPNDANEMNVNGGINSVDNAEYDVNTGHYKFNYVQPGQYTLFFNLKGDVVNLGNFVLDKDENLNKDFIVQRDKPIVDTNQCSYGEQKCQLSERFVCEGGQWINKGNIVGECGFGDWGECIPGEERCDEQVYELCSYGTWQDQGTIDGKCGYTGQSSTTGECIPGEERCESTYYYLCVDINWLLQTKVDGKCGYVLADDIPTEKSDFSLTKEIINIGSFSIELWMLLVLGGIGLIIVLRK